MSSTPSRIRELQQWLADHSAEIVADLAAYVSIETPSGELDALGDGLAWLRGWLADRLGPAAAEQTNDDPVRGTSVVLDYAGLGDKRIVLLAHYDTVWKLGTLSERPWSVDGDIGRGPGCFDMKAGLVQAVWGLVAARQLGIAMPPVRIVLNPDEEVGSLSSRAVIERASIGADAVFVYESSAAGALKTARSGVGLFQVDVTGLAAHAGLNPTAGASAIDELARVILALNEARDLAKGTSVNVGIIAGGSRANVTAAEARANVDVRVVSSDEAARIDGVFSHLRPQDARASITVTGGWNRPVMERTAAAGLLFARARALGSELGVDLQEVAVGGASDGNFVAHLGIPVLDGLGAVGGGAHADDEWVDLAEMPFRAALSAALIADFAP